MPRHPRPASSTASLSRSVFEALSRRAAAYPGQVFRLSVGDTWREPLPAARAEALRTLDVPNLHCYAPPQGEPVLLDAIEADLARRGEAVARERIQVVSGATVGLSVTCQTLLDPGDEVLLLAPYWPLFPGIVASRGGKPVEVPFYTRLDEAGFDVETCLEEKITPRTVAIYLNTPNNPTGRVLATHDLDAISRVAERHDLWIVSDEVYEDLVLDGTQAPSPWRMAHARERTIATHSVSKSHGLAGIRVGWTHGSASVTRELRAVQVHQAYCAAKPMQLAAARALTQGGPWLEEARRLYRDAATSASEALGQSMPEAGTFLFFDASPWLAGGSDAQPFLERCADEGVLLTPGAACGPSYATWVRLCFTTVPPHDLEEALSRLRRVLAC